MDIELQDMSPRDPPPVYTERDDGQRGRISEPPPPYPGNNPNPCSFMGRSNCSDPTRSSFPGICRFCFIMMCLSIVIFLITLFVTIAYIAMLTKGHKSETVFVIVLIATFLLMCVKLTFAMSAALAALCRILHVICLAMVFVLSEVFGPKGIHDPIGTPESPDPLLLPQLCMLLLILIAIVTGVLILAYYLICFWHTPECWWTVLVISSLLCFLIAAICSVISGQGGVRHTIIACTVLGSLCSWCNAGSAALETCTSLRERVRCIGSMTPLGQAREPSQNGRRGRLEDEVSCSSLILEAMLTLLVLVLMILCIPLVCAWIRMRLEEPSKESTVVLLTCTTLGVTGGFGLGQLVPKPKVTSEKLCSKLNLIILLLVIIVILLTVCNIPCALVLHCVLVGVMLAITFALLRAIGRTRTMLPLAFIVRALLTLLLIMLGITPGIAASVDSSWS